MRKVTVMPTKADVSTHNDELSNEFDSITTSSVDLKSCSASLVKGKENCTSFGASTWKVKQIRILTSSSAIQFNVKTSNIEYMIFNMQLRVPWFQPIKPPNIVKQDVKRNKK